MEASAHRVADSRCNQHHHAGEDDGDDTCGRQCRSINVQVKLIRDIECIACYGADDPQDNGYDHRPDHHSNAVFRAVKARHPPGRVAADEVGEEQCDQTTRESADSQVDSFTSMVRCRDGQRWVSS